MKNRIKQLILLPLCLIACVTAFAQPPATDAEIEKAYQKRIKKEYLHRVYIPKDMADAFAQLNKLIADADRQKFKALGEEDAVNKLFFSLGRWISHNWGFYGGSRLSHYMKSIGVHHPDDMSTMIIRSYHRYLNKKDLNIKEQLAKLEEKQEAEKKKRQENSTIIHEETRKRKQ